VKEPDLTAGEQGAGVQSKTTLRRKIIHAIQLILAFVLIAILLSKVQIGDVAIFPPGSPLAGEHEGKLTRDGNSAVFLSEGLFTLEAVYVNDRILEARLILEEGSPEPVDPEILRQIELKEGLLSCLKRTDPIFFVEALGIYILAYVCAIVRWKVLLDAAGLPTSIGRATRLSCIGLFFNNLVPGLTGGDLVKCYYVAKENRNRKTDAIITVIADRVMGMAVLAAFSAVAVLTDIEKYWQIALSIYLFLAAILGAALVFYSGRLRRLFFVDKIIDLLPFTDLIRKVDRSAFLYRYRKRALFLGFLLTVGVHLFVILSLSVLGKGLGIECDLITYAILVPIILIVSALPVTPAGWGWGEVSFVAIFGFAGVPAVLALALSFIHRFNTLAISLSGGVFLLFGKSPPHETKEVES